MGGGGMSSLTPKQARFVEEYLVDLNATQAAIRAGYSAKTAYSQGQRLLKNVEVEAAIQKAQDARANRTEVTVDKVLKELATIGFSDIGTYFDMKDGTIVRRDWSDLPAGATGVIQEVTQEEHTGGRGRDTGKTRRTKVRLYSKLDALEKIARHLGMFTEKIKLEGSLLDEFSPHELAALVEHLRAAGFGSAGGSGEETRH
jgi:phage terminase small subunit